MASTRLEPLAGTAPAYAPLRISVMEAIREAILDGRIAPGEPLIESHLAEQLGVSRTPVREGLRALEREGLITALPGRRLIVAKPTEREIQHLYDIRLALESLAVRRAAGRVVAADAAALRAMVADMREALAASDVARLELAGRRFHEGLLRLSGNEILESMLGSVAARTHYLRRLGLASGEAVAARTTDEHAALCEAVIAGDAEEAEALIERHIEFGRETALRELGGEATPMTVKEDRDAT
ncbi:MAG TPA: GntR family transcriptional regulator [Thermodesulfobacteriota bacterium]